MAKKLTSVVGIDIGSQTIKVAEVRIQGKEPVISALGVIDTPEGAVDHTGVYNSDAVGVALKQVLGDSGATVPNAVVSIAGQASVLVRTLPVPRMNPSELKDHMQWEINRNIPFAESTVVSDFKPLGDDDPNSTNMDVVMAISPQSAIDTILACIKKAGKTTSAIDVEPLAIARSLQTSSGAEISNQTVCVVEMGHKTTSINIYRNGKLLQPRQIPIGGEMFTRAIADNLTLPMDQAEQEKRTRCEIPESAATAAPANPFGGGGGATQQFQPYNPFSDDPAGASPAPATGGFQPYNPFADDATGAAPAPDPSAFDPMAGAPEPASPAPAPAAGSLDDEALRVYNAIAGVLDEFVAEVRRSIDYFRSRDGEIDRIVLCGGGTKIKGLATFLSKSLGISVENYDPLKGIQVNAKKLAPGFADEHRQEFTVAVGNGLHILFD